MQGEDQNFAYRGARVVRRQKHSGQVLYMIPLTLHVLRGGSANLPNEQVHAVVDVYVQEVLRIRLEVHEEPAERDVDSGFLDATRVFLLLFVHLAVHDVLVRVGQSLLTALLVGKVVVARG